MATVNFSVPDEIKDAFNATFANQNKSAIIAALMQEAVERAHKRQASQEAFQRILARRQQAPKVTDAQIHAARQQARP